ncbi:MAG: CBS domain-containing protein [Acidimicrobiia bacterium]|nr:CBS domain-containing protein [Acidimicrobiia bacterium]
MPLETTGPRAPITAYMSDEIVLIDPSTTLRQAAVALDEAGVGCLVVGSADAVEGVLSERDLLRAIAEGLDLDTNSVAALESTELKWATLDSTIGEVADEMMQNYVRHVLVGDERRLVGMLSMRDALAAMLN